MEQEIKTAILEAMGKLTCLSMDEEAMNGHSIIVALHGEYSNDIWITCCPYYFVIIKSPTLRTNVCEFRYKVEKVISDLKAKFHSPAEVLSTLNTGVNE